MVIDRAKASRVQKILGTKTLAATVDAAFDEVIRLDGRRRIMARPGRPRLVDLVRPSHYTAGLVASAARLSGNGVFS